jgi:hypothetical protein
MKNIGLYGTRGDNIGGKWDISVLLLERYVVVSFCSTNTCSRFISTFNCTQGFFYEMGCCAMVLFFACYNVGLNRLQNSLGIESQVAWATPGSFTIQNVPCNEDASNCKDSSLLAHIYEDPSTHHQINNNKLRQKSSSFETRAAVI